MLPEDKFKETYNEIFKGCKSFEDDLKKLKSLNGEYAEKIRRQYCNLLLYDISRGYTKYTLEKIKKDELVIQYLSVAKLLSKDETYFNCIANFFNGNYRKVISLIEVYFDKTYADSKDKINSPEEFFDECALIDMYFEPFKQGFPAFWTSLADILRKYPVQEGIPELCEAIDKYYTCKSDEDALELLFDMVQRFPHFTMVKELIGYTYYSMKMWNNAIAYFESVEEKPLFFFEDDLYFMLAWCHGKNRNRKLEEDYYCKILEIHPKGLLYLNNLGYCLYQQKKYDEAIECFEQCLNIDSNYLYSNNNYVRVLIAQGKYKDAKSFIKTGHKVSKDIEKRVEKLENKNCKPNRNITIRLDENEDAELSQEKAVDLGIKRQQFSSEKLLEDELTARIESGMEVFGKKLKMYKRKGVYGRQFIIPIGRLDLLCEDEKGDLYIIELKKDSGYDDAYKQTAAYLDWFEQDSISEGKNVYGIICLNSPTTELIKKVHADNRMRLYEYQISYTEI